MFTLAFFWFLRQYSGRVRDRSVLSAECICFRCLFRLNTERSHLGHVAFFVYFDFFPKAVRTYMGKIQKHTSYNVELVRHKAP